MKKYSKIILLISIFITLTSANSNGESGICADNAYVNRIELGEEIDGVYYPNNIVIWVGGGLVGNLIFRNLPYDESNRILAVLLAAKMSESPIFVMCNNIDRVYTAYTVGVK